MILRVLLALLLSCSAAQALNGRPEVVVIIADDVSTNGFGTYGETDSVIGTNYNTDELDTLAAAGQVYLNFLAEPLCSPSRRAFWYGMSTLQHGAGKAINEDNRVGVPWMQRESLVSALQAVGVQVGIVGKHHIQDFGDNTLLGTAATQPAAMGFDFSPVMMLGNPGTEYPPTTGSPHADGNHHYSWIESDPDTGAGSINTTYTTDAFTAAAVAALQDSSDMRPMLLVLNYSAPHTPFNPPPGDGCAASQSADEVACYGPAITYIDDDLPSIIAELDFAEDTLIFVGDNGRPNPAGGTEHCPVNTSKGQANPCGTRVPMVVRGVAVVTTGNVAAPLTIRDLHNTLLEIFDAPQTGQDSESFVDCFTNRTTCAPRTVSSASVFSPNGLPVAMHEGLDFDKYQMYFETIGGTTLYGMTRVYDDANNDVDTFEDSLYDLGSPTNIDETKRYAPEAQEIEVPSPGEQQDAMTAMQDEATRLEDSRWGGPPNQMIGVTMTGVETN